MADPVDPATQKLIDETSVRRILTMVRWLLYLVFVVIGFVILKRLGPVLAPVLVAAAIAYLLDPWVDRLEARGMRRGTAVFLMLCGFLGVLVLAIMAMVPLVANEVRQLIDDLPALVLRAEAWAYDQFGMQLPEEWREHVVSGEMGKLVEKAVMPALGLSGALVGGLVSIIGLLAELMLIPLFAFYFSVSWDKMLARIRRFIPARYRHDVGDIALEIDKVVSGWIRGAFTVTAILAVLYAVSFKIIGLHLAIPMGLIVGFLTIVPFLGTLVGAALTACVILIDYQGPRQLIATGGVFVVLHLLEAGVLTPKIVGHKVGLGEVGALFAVVAGGKLLGVTGVILAVPLAASVMVLVRRVVQYYEKSGFYTDGAVTAYVAEAEQVVKEEGERAHRDAEKRREQQLRDAEAEDAAQRAAAAWKDDEPKKPPEGDDS